jgi:hypothetical protein
MRPIREPAGGAWDSQSVTIRPRPLIGTQKLDSCRFVSFTSSELGAKKIDFLNCEDSGDDSVMTAHPLAETRFLPICEFYFTGIESLLGILRVMSVMMMRWARIG